MTDWDTVLKHLEQRWGEPRVEVCEQLVTTIRYAVFTPLDFARNASNLLKENAKSSQIRSWAEECHQWCQDRLDGYWKLQERCLDNSDDKEMTCKCILQGVGPLLAGSVDILSQGAQILDLVEEELAKIAQILLQKLSVIAQIHDKSQSQDLSWLLAYIDEEDKLRRGRV